MLAVKVCLIELKSYVVKGDMWSLNDSAAAPITLTSIRKSHRLPGGVQGCLHGVCKWNHPRTYGRLHLERFVQAGFFESLYSTDCNNLGKSESTDHYLTVLTVNNVVFDVVNDVHVAQIQVAFLTQSSI